MNGQIERDLVDRLCVNAWVMACALSIAAGVYLPFKFTAGVVLGAFLVAVNLLLLRRVVFRALRPNSKVTPKQVLPGYYMTFLVTVMLIAVVVLFRLVNPYGLLLGLSIFCVNLFWVALSLTAKIFYESIFKEAV